MSETSNRFPPEVEAILREAGWFPGRVVDDATLAQWFAFPIRDLGICTMCPSAWRVLREFGGLHFDPKNSQFRFPTSLNFDPLQGRIFLGRDWIFSQWQVEDYLYPLAVYEDYDAVCITPQGHVYTLRESSILHGTSFEEALTNLLRFREGWEYNEVTELSSENGLKDAWNVSNAVQRVWLEHLKD